MAGYIITLNNEESLRECIKDGVYSTILSNPSRRGWGRDKEGTFADYLSMRPGDSIYFFIKRKIYGIGEIVNISSDCKYWNYVGAEIPKTYPEDYLTKNPPLLEGSSLNNRCFCTFIPKPYFFQKSVDMDEALTSNPSKFRSLRAMWKVSFIKIDEEENQALQDVILKKNEEELTQGNNTFSFVEDVHIDLERKLTSESLMNPNVLLELSADGESIAHEMAIEAYLCSILGKENDSPFGQWDYISHQVIASPFKPIDYMDKIDIFGYRKIPGYSTISRYLMIEIKKDKAQPEVIDQAMKYVDWINQEYSHGDYSMIEAYIIAESFDKELIEKSKLKRIRNYTKGFRPTESCIWDSLKLVEYSFEDGKMKFDIVNEG